MQRFRSIAYYGAPILLYLAVHAAGFRAWFLSDDFGWLAMRSQVHSSGDLFHALFSPMAQGTIRTLSERAYYMSLSSIFGLNPLPFHVMSFVVMCANLVLLARIVASLVALDVAIAERGGQRRARRYLASQLRRLRPR